jgi:hypothetical protein
MRDITVELLNIQSGINHLKGLVAKLGNSAASVPTVDFVCDMFDRTDQPVLDGYWTDTAGNWALRNNRAIYQGTDGAVATGTYTLSNSAALGFTITPNPISAASWNAYQTILTGGVISGNQRPNLYTGRISNPDFQVKITFDALAPVTGAAVSNTVVSNFNPTSVSTVTTTVQALTSYPTNCGIAVGSRTPGRMLGASCNGFIGPAMSAPGVSGSASVSGILFDTISSPVISVAAGASLNGTFGLLNSAVGTAAQTFQNGVALPASTNLPNIFAQYPATPDGGGVMLATSQSTPGVAGLSSFATNPAAPPLVAGTNTMLLQATGDTYSVYLNGVLWYTVTQVLMTDRAQPGLLSTVANLMGYIGTQSGLGYYGVTSFKAWPIGQAEPLNESGHGTYASGYSDKYHASGSYNPLA